MAWEVYPQLDQHVSMTLIATTQRNLASVMLEYVHVCNITSKCYFMDVMNSYPHWFSSPYVFTYGRTGFYNLSLSSSFELFKW